MAEPTDVVHMGAVVLETKSMTRCRARFPSIGRDQPVIAFHVCTRPSAIYIYASPRNRPGVRIVGRDIADRPGASCAAERSTPDAE